MKRSNSGYTLVELLLTMCIFSMVMLGVIGIMRSTSVIFRDGVAETDVQTETQMVVNQIESMVVDATSQVTSLGAGKYKIESNGSNYFLKQNGKDLLFSTVDGNYELLAEDVKVFSINNNVADDNRVTVTLCVEKETSKGNKNKKYSYTAEKEVYYRNDVENQTSHSTFISGDGGIVSIDPSAPVVTFNEKYELSRYSKINLNSMFGFKPGSVISLTTGSDVYYDLTQITVNGQIQYTISCNSLLNGDFTMEALQSGNYGVTGVKEVSGVDVSYSVNLFTPVVTFDVGNGIVTLTQKSALVTPRCTYLLMKGFNAYNAVSNGVAIKCKYTLYKDENDNDEYDSGEEYNDWDNASRTINAITKYDSQNSGYQRVCNSPVLLMSVQAADGVDGLAIGQGNEQCSPDTAFANAVNSGNLRVAVEVTIAGAGGGGHEYKQIGDYCVVMAGTNITGSQFIGHVYN